MSSLKKQRPYQKPIKNPYLKLPQQQEQNDYPQNQQQIKSKSLNIKSESYALTNTSNTLFENQVRQIFQQNNTKNTIVGNSNSCYSTNGSIASDNHIQNLSFPTLEQLNLSQFKTKPCLLGTPHVIKTCFYYHNSKDQRRDGCYYSSDICEKQNCQGCDMAHNRVESLYHPDKYKKKFCSLYPDDIKSCKYQQYCSFAHNEYEIQIPLLHLYIKDDDFYMFHYKTEWCPFNLQSHEKNFCVYAHNNQDFRRKPQYYQYSPQVCEQWGLSDYVKNYKNSCSNEKCCPFSHGWKESEFHPLLYKTRQCLGGKNCQAGRDCPFYHSQQEMRIVNQSVNQNFFKFFPRNRHQDSYVTKMYEIQRNINNNSKCQCQKSKEKELNQQFFDINQQEIIKSYTQFDFGGIPNIQNQTTYKILLEENNLNFSSQNFNQ